MNTLEYRGYKGTIETEDDTLLGHVLGFKNVIISYEEKNIDELKDDFQNGIDDYLENKEQQDQIGRKVMFSLNQVFNTDELKFTDVQVINGLYKFGHITEEEKKYLDKLNTKIMNTKRPHNQIV